MKPNLNSTSTEIEKLCVLGGGEPGPVHHSSHRTPTVKHGDACTTVVRGGVFFLAAGAARRERKTEGRCFGNQTVVIHRGQGNKRCIQDLS